MIDFGIAGKFNMDDADEGTAGTLKYMPPEVLSGQNIKSSPAIDVWAIGILAYKCVTK